MPGEVNLHKMILSNLTIGTSLSFYGLLPDQISESHDTNFEVFDIKGRSNPVVGYASSGARSVSVDVKVHEDYLAQYSGGSADIRDFVAAFKSITYPEYSGTRTIAPNVLLRVGNFLRIQGYAASASVTWERPIRNDRFIVANLSMTINEAIDQSFSASQIYAKEDLVRG